MNSCTSPPDRNRDRPVRPSTGVAQIAGLIESHDAHAAAADVGLDDDGIAQVVGRGRRVLSADG
jgi:hypothetical protein